MIVVNQPFVKHRLGLLDLAQEPGKCIARNHAIRFTA